MGRPGVAVDRFSGGRIGRTRAEHHRGQGLVEFAVVAPVILVLLLGLFDIGRVVINYTTLTNASRAGARVAIVNQSNTTTCGAERVFKCVAAEHAVGVGIRPSDVPDVVITGADCARSPDCTVTVTVSQDIDLITPLIGSLVGPFSLSASTTMPVERSYANP